MMPEPQEASEEQPPERIRSPLRKVRGAARELVKNPRESVRGAAKKFEEEGGEFATGFRDFLKNYGILALAIGIIIGTAVNKTVTALVQDIIMPIVTFFIPGGKWREWELLLGSSVVLKMGDFIGAVLDFLVIALVVYLIAKWILKEEKVGKK
jgi:large conductance mechanosensitive channel